MHTLVVINDNSPDSQSLGHYYQQQWDIPSHNICHISTITNYSMEAVTFTNQILDPINTYLAQARLSNQIDCIVLCGDIPYRLISTFTTSFDMNGLPSTLYYGYHTATAPCELPASASNEYYATEQFFTHDLIHTNTPYYICAYLDGWTFDQARHVVDRSKQALFASPTGTIYMLHTQDTDRNVQWPQFNNTAFFSRFINEPLTCDIRDAQSLSGITNIAAYMVGQYSIIWTIFSNTFIPGALGNHLTSYGGCLFADCDQPWQMSILTWLQAGCAGSYGTCREPCAYTEKFPNALIHYWYKRGFSLGECFYMAIQSPYEGVVAGDPLCTPYAHPALISVSGIQSNSTITNSTIIEITAQASHSNRPISHMDIYIDGYYVESIFSNTPATSNTISVTLNGTTRTATVHQGDSLYDLTTRLADSLNMPPSLNIHATPVSDRLSISQTLLGIPASNYTIATTTSIGTGTNLNVFSYVPSTTFLETRYPAQEVVTLSGGVISGDAVRVVITTLDNQNVTNTITAQTNMSTYAFMTEIMQAINTDPALSNSYGCEMRYPRAIDTTTEAYFLSRINSWESSNLYLDYQVYPYTGSSLTDSSFSDYFNDNTNDLYGRAMLFLNCGSTNVSLSYTLDPSTLNLTDGPHILQCITREGTAVGTLTRHGIPFQVKRHTLTCDISSPQQYANIPYMQIITATVHATTDIGTVTQLALWVEGRCVGTTNTSPGTFEIAGTNIGAGLIDIQGIAYRNDGARTGSDIHWIQIYRDTDTNNIPDWWAYHYFGTSTNIPTDGDPDNDSSPNIDEYLAATNPTNQHSYFHVMINAPQPAEISLEYISSIYRNYLIYYNDGPLSDASNWQTADTNIYQGAPEATIWYNNSTNGPALTNDMRFYRVEAIVP